MNQTVISYKDALIVSLPYSVDIIDPVTNKWTTAKSIQAAKWNITVWRRLCNEFVFAKGNLNLA